MAILALIVATLISAGCDKDTDCKGDRVCEDGKCVAPAPIATPATQAPPPMPPPQETRRVPLGGAAPCRSPDEKRGPLGVAPCPPATPPAAAENTGDSPIPPPLPPPQEERRVPLGGPDSSRQAPADTCDDPLDGVGRLRPEC